MLDNYKQLPCIKILPSVYNNSMSYYEVLCSLANAVDTANEKITELEERVAKLEAKSE